MDFTIFEPLIDSLAFYIWAQAVKLLMVPVFITALFLLALIGGFLLFKWSNRL